MLNNVQGKAELGGNNYLHTLTIRCHLVFASLPC
jgi:hypothetical protein